MELGRYFNARLIGEPMNWLIVGVTATIWLLFFHVILQGFTAMQAGSSAPAAAPGQALVSASPPQINQSGTAANYKKGLSEYSEMYIPGSHSTMFDDGSAGLYAESGSFSYAGN